MFRSVSREILSTLMSTIIGICQCYPRWPRNRQLFQCAKQAVRCRICCYLYCRQHDKVATIGCRYGRANKIESTSRRDEKKVGRRLRLLPSGRIRLISNDHFACELQKLNLPRSTAASPPASG